MNYYIDIKLVGFEKETYVVKGKNVSEDVALKIIEKTDIRPPMKVEIVGTEVITNET